MALITLLLLTQPIVHASKFRLSASTTHSPPSKHRLSSSMMARIFPVYYTFKLNPWSTQQTQTVLKHDGPNHLVTEGRPTFKTWFAADKEWKDDTIVFEARPKEGARVPV